MRQRVTYARELVAAGHRPAVVARVLQISRQAIYRTPTKAPAVARRARPPACEVEAAIVEIAQANPTDGYRLVTAWVRRRLGRPVTAQVVPLEQATRHCGNEEPLPPLGRIRRRPARNAPEDHGKCLQIGLSNPGPDSSLRATHG